LQPRDATKKLTIKEMSAELASLLPKHNKLMEKDKTGKWVQVAEAKAVKPSDTKPDPKATPKGEGQ
jgi:hypothetical protein